MKRKTLYLILILLGLSCGAICPLVLADDGIQGSNNDLKEYGETNDTFTYGGYLKYLHIERTTDSYSKYSQSFQDYNKEKILTANLLRLRLTSEINASDHLYFYISLDAEAIKTSYLDSLEFDQDWRPTTYNDLYKLSDERFDYNKETYQRIKLHRIFTKLFMGSFTLTIGRQQVRFGSGRLWNPLDILNPISPDSKEGSEEEKGIDAIRLEFYPSYDSEVTFVLNPRRTNDEMNFSKTESNMVARFKTSISDIDLALLTGTVSRRTINGFDISAHFFKGLLRGSILHSSVQEDEQVYQGEDSFFHGNVGYEYAFSDEMSILAEYFHNENGLNFNSVLNATYQNSQLFGVNEDNYYAVSNQFFTLNQQYLGLAIKYRFNPLLVSDFFAIYDIQGSGIFLKPSLEYNIIPDLYLNLSISKSYIGENAAYESDYDSLDKYYQLSGHTTYYF